MQWSKFRGPLHANHHGTTADENYGGNEDAQQNAEKGFHDQCSFPENGERVAIIAIGSCAWPITGAIGLGTIGYETITGTNVEWALSVNVTDRD